MQKKTTHVTAALIFDSQNHILISRRPPGTHLAGFWEFPGGTLESGETAQQALLREIKEELALDIEVGQLYFQDVFEYENKFVDISFYICRQRDAAQIPQEIEVAEWKWVRLEELVQFKFPPADKELIRQLLNFDFLLCRI
jgi:mutator protein MutT